MLDGFDFTIVTFLLVDIQNSFHANNAQAGAVLTASALLRVVGGVAAGAAADRWGRKRPLMYSILWYSLFTFLSGFSTSYAVLMFCRALFGLGMGGVWTAGMPLALEHWPARLRGLASGLLQSGYSLGFVLSAIVYQYTYPHFKVNSQYGWRAMLWIGILPAFLVVWIVRRVKESPVWLEKQLAAKEPERGSSLGRLFHRDLIRTTAQTTLFMASMLFLYNSIAYLYPTFLRESGRATVGYVVALNFGGVLGVSMWGRLSESWLGRRGAASLATMLGLLVLWPYLFTGNGTLLLAGAFAMGLFGIGNFGVVPGYLSERFPTAARATGAGFSYQAGAGFASFAPALIGSLKDAGLALNQAMTICIIVSAFFALLFLWLGPETRGLSLRSVAAAG
jgi:MFS family permease